MQLYFYTLRQEKSGVAYVHEGVCNAKERENLYVLDDICPLRQLGDIPEYYYNIIPKSVIRQVQRSPNGLLLILDTPDTEYVRRAFLKEVTEEIGTTHTRARMLEQQRRAIMQFAGQ